MHGYTPQHTCVEVSVIGKLEHYELEQILRETKLLLSFSNSSLTLYPAMAQVARGLCGCCLYSNRSANHGCLSFNCSFRNSQQSSFQLVITTSLYRLVCLAKQVWK